MLDLERCSPCLSRGCWSGPAASRGAHSGECDSLQGEVGRQPHPRLPYLLSSGRLLLLHGNVFKCCWNWPYISLSPICDPGEKVVQGSHCRENHFLLLVTIQIAAGAKDPTRTETSRSGLRTFLHVCRVIPELHCCVGSIARTSCLALSHGAAAGVMQTNQPSSPGYQITTRG